MPSIIKISTTFALLAVAHAKIDALASEINLVARGYPIGGSSYASTVDSKAGADSAKKSGYKAAKRSGTDSAKTGKTSSSKAHSQSNDHYKVEYDQAYPHAAASVPQGYTDSNIYPVKVEDHSSEVPIDTPAPVGEPADAETAPIGDNEGYSSTYPEADANIDHAGSVDDTSGPADTMDTSVESPTVTDSMPEMEETTIAEPSAYPEDTSSDSGILDSSTTKVSFVGFAGLVSLLFL